MSNKNMQGVVFAILDAVVIFSLSLLIFTIRHVWDHTLQPLEFYIPFFLTGAAAFIFCGVAFSLYDRSRTLFSLSYVADFLKTYILWVFFLIAFPFFIKTSYSRIIVFLLLISTGAFLYVLRILIAFVLPEEQSHGIEVTNATRDVANLLQITTDPLLLLRGMRMTQPSALAKIAKRLLDIVVSFFALIVVGIVTPFIAYLIHNDTPGPIVITQTRIGKNGKPFNLYKFRSMVVTTELYSFAPREGTDKRITPVGKILRKYSIDELPQFWNVFIGNMSLVGPRPEMPFIVEKYHPWQRTRLQVIPGITGLWQIYGRKDLPLEENLEYDLYYVFNQSFFLDCAILLQTIPHLIFPKGAY